MKKTEPSDNEMIISAAFNSTIVIQIVQSFIFHKHWILLLSGFWNFKPIRSATLKPRNILLKLRSSRNWDHRAPKILAFTKPMLMLKFIRNITSYWACKLRLNQFSSNQFFLQSFIWSLNLPGNGWFPMHDGIGVCLCVKGSARLMSAQWHFSRHSECLKEMGSLWFPLFYCFLLLLTVNHQK